MGGKRLKKKRPKSWIEASKVQGAEDKRCAMQVLEMEKVDEYKRTYRQALEIYERFKREAESEGERIPGWAGKVGV